MAKALLDLETGDVTPIVNSLKRRNGGFFMGVQEAILEIAGNKDFSGAEHKVLLGILGVMDYGGYAAVTQSKLAELVGLSKVSVNTAIGKLVRAGVISKEERLGIVCYRVSPAIAQKGKE